jgi:L-aspartate oxidase
LHHKDNTGFEMQQSLIRRIADNKNIEIFENHFAIEILTQHHLGEVVTQHTPNIECYGAYVLNEETNHIHKFLAKITLLATGGIGSVYATTTNPEIATGDGIAMVHRARGVIQDMEFVQFHPTGLYNPGERPTFLITEAIRGYGAVLRCKDGREFMQKYDERGSLAPRDIVARAIDNEMKIRGHQFVYLDVTHKNADETKEHFPNIYKKCLSLGIDITKDMIPVSPTQHYLCGGIVIDEHSRTTIKSLYAAGECTCTGLHGANRLASNSLLEALVYSDAAVKHATTVLNSISFNEFIPDWNDDGTKLPEEMVLITQSFREVEQIMSTYVGIVRSNLRLKRAMSRLEILFRETEDLFDRSVVSREICELRNVISVAYLIIKHALRRKESRGLHYTIDYPKRMKSDK